MSDRLILTLRILPSGGALTALLSGVLVVTATTLRGILQSPKFLPLQLGMYRRAGSFACAGNGGGVSGRSLPLSNLCNDCFHSLVPSPPVQVSCVAESAKITATMQNEEEVAVSALLSA